jgi:hypothetical protein
MNAVRNAIKRTRRRVFVDRWLRTLGWLALAWVGIALSILLADRLASLTLPVNLWWTFGVPAGVLFMLAPILAWMRRPDEKSTAGMIDERLGLKDSLGTAIYVETLKDNPFAHQVQQDANRLASKTRLDEAFTIRLGAGWGYAAPAGAVLALLVAFLPAGLDLLGLNEREAEQQFQQAQAEEAQRQILEANTLVRNVKTSESELVEADPDDILKDLASLTQRDLTNPDFRRETIAKLADVQEKLAAAEQAKHQQIQTVKNQMSRLDPGKRGPADRFADAMRRGDFEAAQKELQRLADGLEGMPAAEKNALQQQLQNMADQVKQMAAQQKQIQQQAQQNIQKQLKQAGLSQQQIQQLQQQGYSQQAVQKALQQQGMSQQQAQQTAKQVQQQQQQAQNANQSASQNQGLSSSFGQMAQSLGQQGQQSQQNQQGQQQGQQGQQQGQQGQQGSQFSQSAWQGQQQLSQMAQMQNQMQQMQQAQQQMQNAMNSMNQNGQGQGQQQSQGAGQGGQKAGSGIDNNPLGKPYQTGPYAVRTEGDIQQKQGRVIASWQEDGEMSAGDATVEFDRAITEARTDAERAVTEDRVPRRYHESIKDYFKQLPDAPDEVRQAPAAPR